MGTTLESEEEANSPDDAIIADSLKTLTRDQP